ncbi:unnamed protein product [Cyprideis torosa]|uniref:tRNA-uridine aminocarboxypropyltransferase 1 n=1 Tax=Cyprideis torosa TaxID=163714 RepID=A0A7R8W7L0_9CRUS|nr:unnamed protein product [Cyprideis torosa]CAG0887697.1 unnamed protein product [Cyprideis torosa]
MSSEANKPPDEDDLWEALEVTPADVLEGMSVRSPCPNCNRSRMYFCYTCFIPVASLHVFSVAPEGRLPNVRLPVDVDIIKHPKEVEGKSTAVHAAVLAPAQVKIYTHPIFPDYPSDGSVLLVFPSPEARSIEAEMALRNSQASSRPLKKLVFIDSTWNQTPRIVKDPRLKSLPRVKLEGVRTLFWRYQHGKPRTHLATIEAIYHALRVVRSTKEDAGGDNGLGNLLFFFKFMYDKVVSLYGKDNIKAFQDVDDVDLRFAVR